MVRNCPVNCKVPEEQSWQQLGEHRLEPSENTGNISPVFVQIGTPPAPGQAGEAAAEIAVDPVCHMIVPKTGPGENNSESTNFRGQTYYFCHVNCLLKFNRNPKAYAKDNYFEEDDETVNLDVIKMPEIGGGEAASINGTANGTTTDTADGDGRGGEVKDPKAVEPSFTCPMHPEVLTKKPGPCPLCGMALESLDPTVSGEDDTELIDMENRLKWATPFTALAVLMNVPDMVGIPPDAFVPQVTPYLVSMAQLAVVTPVIWLARPFFERAADSIKNQSYNMFTLIATGVGISYFYSLVAILLPSLIPSGFGMRDPVHSGLQNVLPYTYFEPAAVIATLAMLGQVLELKARKQTGLAIRELMSLTPQHAHFVKVDDSEIDIALSKLAIDDKLRVRPGESVPLDGIVIDGRSSINESMITGEANLVDKSDGDTVIGGTINHAGAFVMQVKALGEDTLVARIVKLVVGAQRSRPPVQKAVDKIASYFVPAVIAASIITFVAWAYLGEAPALEKALLSAISVLIIACPCALGLATPMSVMVAMGRGAKSGILVRDAEALDKLSEINTLVVDKTGTLTEGKPTVNKVITFGRFAEGQMMMLAAAAESLSEHPIGRAFVDHASLRGLAECHAHDFVYQPGGGVTATADGHQMVIGSQAFLFDKLPGERKYMQKVLDGSAEAIKALGEGGATIVMVVCDDELAACVAVSDKVRESARATVDELKARGIKVHMLSGDLEPTARFVADQLGITDVAAGIGPTDKHAFIKKLQETPGTVVAMAGDGINDAPALAQADVGIAMGTGTNIAIDSAGIILVHGDLTAILRALNLSQAMKANIKQNLALAFGYNLLAVPIAAGVLYPFNHMLLDPMLASACMALSSLSVIANALRLRRTQI